MERGRGRATITRTRETCQGQGREGVGVPGPGSAKNNTRVVVMDMILVHSPARTVCMGMKRRRNCRSWACAGVVTSMIRKRRGSLLKHIRSIDAGSILPIRDWGVAMNSTNNTPANYPPPTTTKTCQPPLPPTVTEIHHTSPSPSQYKYPNPPLPP